VAGLIGAAAHAQAISRDTLDKSARRDTRRRLVFRSLTKTAILVTLITLVSACGPVATVAPPTATAVPPTATVAPPTAAAVPLTASPADLPPFDNGTIAFSTRRDGTNGTDVYVMNADGTDQRQLTNNPRDDLVSDFSPDGQKLAFHSNRSGLSWPKILIGHAAQEYDRL
jgi:hypothetical protein